MAVIPAMKAEIERWLETESLYSSDILPYEREGKTRFLGLQVLRVPAEGSEHAGFHHHRGRHHRTQGDAGAAPAVAEAGGASVNWRPASRMKSTLPRNTSETTSGS